MTSSAPDSSAVTPAGQTGENTRKSEELGKELRDKIRSKFQVATFLSGFCFTILNGQVALLRRPEEVWMLPLSVALLVAAAIIFVSSVMHLDGLMMPKLFRRRHAARELGHGPHTPVSQFSPPPLEPEDFWFIKRRMVFVWVSMTLMATALTFLSLILAMLPYHIYLSVEDSSLSNGNQPPTLAATNLSRALELVYWAVPLAIGYIGLITGIMYMCRKRFGRFYID